MDDIQRLCSLIVAHASGCEAWIEDDQDKPDVCLSACAAKAFDCHTFISFASRADFLRYRFFNGKAMWNITKSSFAEFSACGDVEAWQDESSFPSEAEIKAWISQL